MDRNNQKYMQMARNIQKWIIQMDRNSQKQKLMDGQKNRKIDTKIVSALEFINEKTVQK